MKRIRVDPAHVDDAALMAPAAALANGGVVAIPTETVYGLGANALDAQAVRKIFAAKGRPATNPLIVHISDVSQVSTVVREWPASAQLLADAFWPGPLTLVLRKAAEVPEAVTAGLDTVGVRLPAHPVARRLIELAGVPVAAPSANRYMGVSPTTADHVVKSLEADVDWVVDAGPTQVGLESTVVSLVGRPKILRLGMILEADLARVIPEIESYADEVVEGIPAASPGLARRHYAPTAQVIVGPPELKAALSSPRVGMMVFDRPHDGSLHMLMPRDPEAYARELYNALHVLDDAGCDYILVEPPPREPAWRAIWDRLKRASEAAP